MWQRTWLDGSSRSGVELRAAELSEDESVLYVCGMERRHTGGHRYYVAGLTLRNSVTGERIWGQVLGGGPDYFTDMALSTDGSALFLAGFGQCAQDAANTRGGHDVMLAKVATSGGSAHWYRQWGSDSHDRAWSLALDSAHSRAVVVGSAEGAVDTVTLGTPVHHGDKDALATCIDVLSPGRDILWQVQWGTSESEGSPLRGSDRR